MMKDEVKVFHYLVESSPSVTVGKRTAEHPGEDFDFNQLKTDLAGKFVCFSLGEMKFVVEHDPRDQRQIVAIEGGVDPGSLPVKARLLDSIQRELYTQTARIKTPDPSLYAIHPSLPQDWGGGMTKLRINLLILLIPPMSSFAFWRPRDLKSLWPGWVFAEWKQTPSGGVEIIWKTTAR
jgi:hypothetical protein